MAEICLSTTVSGRLGGGFLSVAGARFGGVAEVEDSGAAPAGDDAAGGDGPGADAPGGGAPGEALAAALADLRAGVDSLSGVKLWRCPQDGLLPALRELAELQARADFARLRLVHELEVRGVAAAAGMASTTGLLAAALRLRLR
jgi:hypothetical protein